MALSFAFEVDLYLIVCEEEASSFAFATAFAVSPKRVFEVTPKFAYWFSCETAPNTLGSAIFIEYGFRCVSFCHIRHVRALESFHAVV